MAAARTGTTRALMASRPAGEMNAKSSAMRAKTLREQIEVIVSKSTDLAHADKPGVRRVRRVKGD